MKRFCVLLAASLLLFLAGDGQVTAGQPAQGGFPQTLRVRLWYLHPPRELRLRAEAGQARWRKCATCNDAPVTAMALRPSGSSIQIDGGKSNATELRISGAYQLSASAPPIHADFPIEVRAGDDVLLVTALLPMEEYVAGVLAGETGNFKSEEALKAMAVAVRTFALHFGSRHALEGFEFCDTTHCQDLRLSGIDARLRKIAEATAGEVLWYDGEPAATYYHANCGGTTEDGRYILGNDEARAPYLTQHSDHYCVRHSGAEWRSEVSKRELQRALADDGVVIPGSLRSVSVLHRTSSGRVEVVRVVGSASVSVSGIAFRSAVGRHIGWERLKSNWYDVSDRGDHVVFHGRGLGHGVGLCQIGAEVMGQEGRSYRQILSYYYPGTRLGVAAQGLAWQQLANDDVELLTARPERDRPLLPIATRYLHAAEESTGLVYRAKPRLKVYATVAEFRNSTGEPGWVAASTRGRTIQMQPPDVLRQTGALESTMHHELLHMLLESYARAGTPQWFREGLVLYLSLPARTASMQVAGIDVAALERSLHAPANEQELRRAYAEAQALVARLAEQHGKDALLGWLQNGLPPEIARGAIDSAAAAHANLRR
ncbi:MAG TPA: SpoIID/LytB domain-containing protein [Terracidiphilus sp.]|nr:SpoIID/LytB domain-containing protein [Terracidiphilus sp.]